MAIYIVFGKQLVGDALIKSPICAVDDEARALKIYNDFADRLAKEKGAREFPTDMARVRELHAKGWICWVSLEEVEIW